MGGGGEMKRDHGKVCLMNAVKITRKALIILALAGSTALGLSACGNTFDGAKKDLKKADQKIQKTLE
jgi:predicted small secreted protein